MVKGGVLSPGQQQSGSLRFSSPYSVSHRKLDVPISAFDEGAAGKERYSDCKGSKTVSPHRWHHFIYRKLKCSQSTSNKHSCQISWIQDQYIKISSIFIYLAINNPKITNNSVYDSVKINQILGEKLNRVEELY